MKQKKQIFTTVLACFVPMESGTVEDQLLPVGSIPPISLSLSLKPKHSTLKGNFKVGVVGREVDRKQQTKTETKAETKSQHNEK